LGQIVADVATEFGKNAPLPLPASPASSPAIPKDLPKPPPFQDSQRELRIREQEAAARQQHEAKFALPAAPKTFPELDALSLKQLEDLKNDDLEFQEFFENLEFVKGPIQVREALYSDLEELATRNLTNKVEVEEMRAAVSALQAQVAERKAKYQALIARQQKVMQAYSIGNLVSALSTAIQRADEDSERVIESFPQMRDADAARFMQEYVAARTVYHLRSQKQERLKVML
jgi:hypothetical protein